jgi:hypothetical protein
MHKTLALFIFLVVSLSAFCQAPEMQKILPTEWKLMERLTESEKVAFDTANKDIYTKIYKTMKNDDENLHDELYLDKETELFFHKKAAIYKETVGSDFFYWILLPVTTVENPIAKPVVVSLFRKEKGMLKLLTLDATNIRLTMQTGYVYRINTIQIIKGREQAKGFIQYLNAAKIDEKFRYTDIEKGQLKGGAYGFYFIFEDEPEDIQLYAENILNIIPQNWNSIRISASDFLWDKDNPLKYSIQNAFDGEPATSFVENTDDDLMEIRLDILIPKLRNINKISLINGYAASNDFYKKNNRLKNGEIISYKIITETGQKQLILNDPVKFLCKNNTLGPQYYIFDIKKRDGALKIKFTDFYKGEKYNDTCLAELNMKTSNNTWLFGDIHE